MILGTLCYIDFKFKKMEIKKEKSYDLKSFEMEVSGGQGNEKVVKIKCLVPFKCVICGSEVTAYVGDVLTFSV